MSVLDDLIQNTYLRTETGAQRGIKSWKLFLKLYGYERLEEDVSFEGDFGKISFRRLDKGVVPNIAFVCCIYKTGSDGACSRGEMRSKNKKQEICYVRSLNPNR